MFDQLPESSKHGQDKVKRSRFFLVTGVIYLLVLLAAGVASIFWLNPALADALDVSVMLTPPPPPQGPPPVPNAPTIKNNPTPIKTFSSPTKVPDKLPDPNTIKPQPFVPVANNGVPGAPTTSTPGVPGVPYVKDHGDPPPPPPQPSPKPTPEATPTPKPSEKIKVSGGVLQGSAIYKPAPVYPPIAKAARAAGSVQVQVTISEEGKVIEALVVSGHPLLRESARTTALQWRFRPTELTGVPVKVQGVLTFNFTLQ